MTTPLSFLHIKQYSEMVILILHLQFISSQLVKLFISLVSHIPWMIQDTPLIWYTLSNSSRDSFTLPPGSFCPSKHPWAPWSLSHSSKMFRLQPANSLVCPDPNRRSWLTSHALSLLLMRISESLLGNTGSSSSTGCS